MLHRTTPYTHEANVLEASASLTVLNAFPLTNATTLCWDAVSYHVTRMGEPQVGLSQRKSLQNVMWQLRACHKDACPGRPFVIASDASRVFVPSTWTIPDHENFPGFKIQREGQLVLRATDLSQKHVIRELLREGIKGYFKFAYAGELGPLWQDFNAFCELPSLKAPVDGIVYCRRFELIPDTLKHGEWVIKIVVNTVSVDARSFADYYYQGEAALLKDLVALKRVNRSTRKNEPTDVRVLVLDQASGQGPARALDLDQPEVVFTHAELEPADQRAHASGTIGCKPYMQPVVHVPLHHVHLILDTQITGELHRETIIASELRADWYYRLRNCLDGMDAYGIAVELSPSLMAIPEQDTDVIQLPSLRIKTGPTEKGVLKAPSKDDEASLERRVRARRRLVRENGYLLERPINPLLACPATHFNIAQAKRMQRNLNWLAKQQGLRFTFGGPLLYPSVDAIVREVRQKQYDTLIAVLPEISHDPQHAGDTHEQIKKSLSIPSQCIHFDNTLRRQWIDKTWKEFREKQAWHARMIQTNYEAIVLNLLVKHGWVPFLPADPFHFNVHVGIDVGGQHNNYVMACMGYGLAEGRPVFLPQRIDMTSPQAEPIHDEQLFQGLLRLFEQAHAPFHDHGIEPNFDRVLFFRDGDFKGQGQAWQEFNALRKLHAALQERGMVHEDSVWVATELSKRASYWRQLRQEGARILNPCVGRVSFPFEDDFVALVSTTGAPYLTQGTAAPLVVRMHPIHGAFRREEVLRDLIWEADMCFTKLDTGMSFPFVLHVADQGALQLSRLYDVSGITV